jgi:hypothetical protein
MSTYKDIQGNLIPVLSSDPSNPEFGDIWYNSTSSSLKAYQYVSVWSTGNNYPLSISQLAGAGTQTAALAFGGTNASPPVPTNKRNTTNKYDETSYSATGNLGTARGYVGGFGTQTAAVAYGGTGNVNVTLSSTENFTGTSWAGSGALPVGRTTANNTGYGTQTAGVMIGAGGSPYTPSAIFNYNGSSWSAGTALPPSFGTSPPASGFGTQTAGLVLTSVTGLATSIEFNGSSWGSTANSNVDHFDGHFGGSQTAGIAATGGRTVFGGLTYTETYDGTTWSNAGNCNTGRSNLARAGAAPSSLSLMMAGTVNGGRPGGSNNTEEWEQAIKTVTFTSS